MTPQTGINVPESVTETRAWLHARKEEIRALSLTDQSLSAMTRRGSAGEAPAQSPPAVSEAVARLEQALAQDDAALMAGLRDELSGELQLWRLLISRHDVRLTADELRRFCTHADTAPGARTLAGLMRFYRSIAHLSQSQSKYDVVATRLFTVRTADQRPRLRFSREQIVTHLARLAATWDESIPDQTCEAALLTAATTQFSDFVSELKQAAQLNHLTDSRLFERMREFKASLGENFYQPAITAAAIECNVACFNRLAALLEAAGGETGNEKLLALIELCSDTTALPADQIARQRDEAIARLVEQSAEPEQAQLKRAIELMQSAPAPEPSAEAIAPPESAREAIEDAAAVSADKSAAETDSPAFTATLEEIENAEGNRVILTMFRQSSPAVQRCDLRLFLSPLAGATDEAVAHSHFRRHALTLIISADHLLQAEHRPDDESAESRREKIAGLLQEVRQAVTDVQQMAGQATQRAQPSIAAVLQDILNCLRQAQHTLQSASFSHLTSRRDRPANAAHPAVSESKAVAATTRAWQAVGKFKWLIVATLLIATAGLFTEFAAPDEQTVARQNADVQTVDLSQMPDGRLLKAARTRRTVMICLVAAEWSQLSAEQRREKIRAWQTFGRARGIDTITLIDARGVAVGSASPDKITVDNT